MTMTLEDQQAIVLKYLPRAISFAIETLRYDDSGELGERIATRLRTGNVAFGSRMFDTTPVEERREEAMEELPDFLIWYASYLYGVDHGVKEKPVSVRPNPVLPSPALAKVQADIAPRSFKPGDLALWSGNGVLPAGEVRIKKATDYMDYDFLVARAEHTGFGEFLVRASELTHA